MRVFGALWVLAVATSNAPAQESRPAVMYIGAESDSAQGLLSRWCDVTPARIGPPAYSVGGAPAPLFSEVADEGANVAFLDADAAAAAAADELAALGAWAGSGGRLIVEGCDRYLAPLGEVLPVAEGEAQACSGPITPVEAGHPALVGVPVSEWDVSSLEVRSRAKPGARVLLSAGAAPLIVVGDAGEGKIVCTPLDHLPERYSWKRTPGYDSVLTLLVLALAGAGDEALLRESWAGAYRYWMYGCFAAGYHKYRFDARGPAIESYDEAESKLAAARRALDAGEPGPAQSLVREGLAVAIAAAERSREMGGSLTTAASDSASTRDDILRLPGTLAVAHGMNLSQGPLGDSGFWYPASGGELLDERPRLDLPRGEAASFWRGLHPYVLPVGTPATEADQKRLWQRTSDGELVTGPNRDIWIHPAVKAAQAQGSGGAHPGAIINETGPDEWNSFGSTPGADFGEFAQAAFRIFLADRGLQPADLGAATWDEVSPPESWAPGRLQYEWQAFRSLYLQERLKTNLWAMKLVDPGSVAALQAGALGDPWRVGVGPGAARYVDLLCPQIVRDAGASTDPVSVEVACRELWSLTDLDGDGAADHPPGYAARFGWSDPLALTAGAHRSAGAIAALTGARGIFEPWASDGAGASAAAAMPEEVFLRWQAAFEPTIRHEAKLLAAAPAKATVGIWDSWHSAAMAEGEGAEGGADTWALSQAREWSELLIRAGLIPRTIYDEHITDDGLAGLRCVIVPSTLCVSDGEAQALRAFAERDGVVVLGCGAGLFDAYHQARDGGLADLSGVKAGPVSVGEERVETALEGKWAKRTGAEKLTLGHALQAISGGTDAGPASLPDGPAFSARKLGKGSVLTVGATVWAGDGATQMVVAGLLEDRGITRRAYAENAEGGFSWQARVLVMDTAKGALVGVANYRPYAEQETLSGLKVRVRMGRGKYRVAQPSEAVPYTRNDGRADQVTSGASDGYIEFEAELAPRAARFFTIDRQ